MLDHEPFRMKSSAHLTHLSLYNNMNTYNCLINEQDGLSNFVWPFFVTLIFISTYFMMNLALAVLYTHFQKESEIRK